MDTKFQEMDTKFQAMDTKFQAIDTKLDLILDEQKRQHGDFQNLTMRVDKLYTHQLSGHSRSV